MKYYSAIRKNKLLPFATTWVELECLMLKKINQTDRDTYHRILCMWNLRNKWTKEEKKRRQKPRFLTREN